MKMIAVVAVEKGERYSRSPTCEVNLSRQSILTLIRQLDLIQTGQSAVSEIRIDNLIVTAVEDAAYYVDRLAGPVLPFDEPYPDPTLKWMH